MVLEFQSHPIHPEVHLLQVGPFLSYYSSYFPLTSWLLFLSCQFLFLIGTLCKMNVQKNVFVDFWMEHMNMMDFCLFDILVFGNDGSCLKCVSLVILQKMHLACSDSWILDSLGLEL